jgi:hypothetical protein
MSRGRRRRLSLLPLMVVAALIATSASPAGAAVTIGQVAPATPPNTCSVIPFDRVQPSVTSGNSFVTPVSGTITSWSNNAGAGAGQTLALKVWRQVSGLTYMAVGHDIPRSLTGSALNTFSGLNIPVEAGDILGLNQASPNPTGCLFDVPGESNLISPGNLADGASGTFIPAGVERRLNISAVVNPTNTFTLGAITRNKKKGTATTTVTVPNPGELTGSGKGVKASGAAEISKAVNPGQAQLLIKAKGKQKRKLNETGKVKLNVAVSYTPTGGDPSTQSVKVKLKKKL